MVKRPIKDTFEYYRDIASYQSRYPRYYGKIEVIYESNGILRTKEFLNLNLDADRDHLSIQVEYQIDEPHKISFEITGKDFIERIPVAALHSHRKYFISMENRVKVHLLMEQFLHWK
jgi:hypothetical protein